MSSQTRSLIERSSSRERGASDDPVAEEELKNRAALKRRERESEVER